MHQKRIRLPVNCRVNRRLRGGHGGEDAADFRPPFHLQAVGRVIAETGALQQFVQVGLQLVAGNHGVPGVYVGNEATVTGFVYIHLSARCVCKCVRQCWCPAVVRVVCRPTLFTLVFVLDGANPTRDKSARQFIGMQRQLLVFVQNTPSLYRARPAAGGSSSKCVRILPGARGRGISAVVLAEGFWFYIHLSARCVCKYDQHFHFSRRKRVSTSCSSFLKELVKWLLSVSTRISARPS